MGKLFNIVKPHVAVFGAKDFQQLQVIKSMTRDLNFDVEILSGEIIREADGLAMSSRNKYLSPSERKSALILSRSLQKARLLLDEGKREAADIIEILSADISATAHCRVDYVKIVDPENLREVARVENESLLALAVFVGQTRLIDNCLLRKSN